MSSTKSKNTIREAPRDELIARNLSRLNHRDLQKECVMRGMEFNDVVNSDHHGLATFFYNNFEKALDPILLNEFDRQMEEVLISRGYKKGDAVFAPCLRLGFIPESMAKPRVESGDNSTTIKIDVKPAKPKATINADTGVRSGTKKDLTFRCAKEGIPIEKTIATVLEQFPDAQEKSIKIWYKRALNGQ